MNMGVWGDGPQNFDAPKPQVKAGWGAGGIGGGVLESNLGMA